MRFVGVILLLRILWGQEPALTPVPFTLADRDRLLRIEERLQALEKRIEQLEARVDRLEARIDRLEARIEMTYPFYTLLTVLVGVLGAVVGLIGFVLWDRRATLRPLEQKLAELIGSLNEVRHLQKEVLANAELY